jgi:hypothetical protein
MIGPAIMDLLTFLITFGGSLFCMAIPVLGLGALILWLAPRISDFFAGGKNAPGA